MQEDAKWLEIEKEENFDALKRSCFAPVDQNVKKSVLVENELSSKPGSGKWKRLARAGNQDMGLIRDYEMDRGKENGKKRVLRQEENENGTQRDTQIAKRLKNQQKENVVNTEKVEVASLDWP